MELARNNEHASSRVRHESEWMGGVVVATAVHPAGYPDRSWQPQRDGYATEWAMSHENQR